MKCRDCGKTMSEADQIVYARNGFESQLVDGEHEGICEYCLFERQNAGEDTDDLITEFCG